MRNSNKVLFKWNNYFKRYFCNKSIKKGMNHQIVKENIQKKSLNSYKPTESQFCAFGHFFPKQWTPSKIQKILDPSKRNINHIEIIKNKIGEPSGKIFLKFNSEQQMQKYLQKYNEDYIVTDDETQRVVILPYDLKIEEVKKQKRENLVLKNPVRLSNLDFDITEPQLRKLANDFGQVTHIDLSMRLNGINRGFGTVYFNTLEQSQSFLSFINGLVYKERKISAHIIQKSKKSWKEQVEEKYLELPRYTMKYNMKMMENLINKKQKISKEIINRKS